MLDTHTHHTRQSALRWRLCKRENEGLCVACMVTGENCRRKESLLSLLCAFQYRTPMPVSKGTTRQWARGEGATAGSENGRDGGKWSSTGQLHAAADQVGRALLKSSMEPQLL